MTTTRAIVATTDLLPNGYQHTLEDLRRMADATKSTMQAVYLDHRPDSEPIGHITDAWIELQPDGEQHALWVEIEHPSNLSQDDIQKLLGERRGMSVAFFGPIAISYDPAEGNPDLILGYSPELGYDQGEMLEVAQQFGLSRRVGAGEYHQHAAVTPTAVLLVFAQVFVPLVVDVVFREHVAAVLRALGSMVKVRGVAPDLVRASFEDGPSRVEVAVPWTGDADAVQAAVSAALRDALRKNQQGGDDYASLDQ